MEMEELIFKKLVKNTKTTQKQFWIVLFNNDLITINKKGTLIMICKIDKDDIEILSSSIKNIVTNDINYPVATNHGFICDFKYFN
jgi:hypothetical protein